MVSRLELANTLMTDSTETTPAGFEVAVRTRSDDVERLEALMLEAGAFSLTLTDAGDHPLLEPAPGATPLWPALTVTGLFEDEAAAAAVIEPLGEAGFEIVARREVGARDWIRAWMDDFKPMRFGERLWIVPTHCEAPSEAELVLVLDPGLAFGTGTHATTALCLEFLDRCELANRRVLDFGCGSGVLAVAAALAGATDVVAIDIDPQAEVATRVNASRNDVADRVHVEDLATVGPHGFQIIVANILAGTLVEQAPVLGRLSSPGCRIALSGLLVDQVPLVRAAYAAEFEDFGIVERDGWALLTATRKDA